MELYIHIPFCVKKCLYCDFLSAPGTEDMQKRYFAALKKQILLWGIREQSRQNGPREVTSIFIGGGTPSIWEAEQISDILGLIKASFDVTDDAEITIESNPGTLNADKLKGYIECGINRISIGLQTADDVLIKTLGRIHNYSQFLESFNMAREAGFKNINVDIMSGLPGQSLSNYEETLHKVLALEPEHISAYSLIVEEGTPFYEMTLSLPDEDTERQMYYSTKRLLEQAGYYRYEISNYAKPGFECKHNLGYWSNVEYIGLGLGASSLDDDVRYRICPDLNEYLEIMESDDTPDRKQQMLMQELQPLDEKAKMEEFCFLGLRKINGISRREFMNMFGRTLDVVYEDVIKKYVLLELLESDGDTLRFTDKGIDVSNVILADFLLDDERG